MRWGSQLADGVRPIIDLVYPPRCPSCGMAVADQEGLCATCWGTLEFPPSEADDGTEVPVDAATFYNETSRKLVLAYKHGGRIALARLLARLIAGRLPDPVEGDAPPLLVPVPLHRWRLWQRGFNQAALLAVELDKLGKGTAMVDALVRRRRTPSLGGLGREERALALRGAIVVNPRQEHQLRGRQIILVDDVLTSGATCRACITALASTKPHAMRIACFARVGP